MALVHCLQSEMPAGRAHLYRQIIGLYLERQERYRQRQTTVDGQPMPHWPVNETRLVLSHLAWLSQHRGSEEKARDPDARRVIWPRRELEDAVREQLANGPGRFATLTPEDARELVKYYLHPAGLLVEPSEETVQFAHLSFQEYLCVQFIHDRGKIRGLEEHLLEELCPHLGKPGWGEVGLLLLCIHAEETSQEGHFGLLSCLELIDQHQAALFVSALTGRELSFTERERRAWLGAGVACALVHPLRDFGKLLAQVDEWKTLGPELLRRLFEADDAETTWDRLERVMRDQAVDHLDSELLTEAMKERWLKPEGVEFSPGAWTVNRASC